MTKKVSKWIIRYNPSSVSVVKEEFIDTGYGYSQEEDGISSFFTYGWFFVGDTKKDVLVQYVKHKLNHSKELQEKLDRCNLECAWAMKQLLNECS